MSGATQQRPEILRLYSIDPGANGVYSVNTQTTGWIRYPEGAVQPAGTNVVLNRTGTGVYTVTLPRNYSRQEIAFNYNLMDQTTSGMIVLALSGAVLPLFNVITISIFTGANAAANGNFILEMHRARVVPAAG